MDDMLPPQCRFSCKRSGIRDRNRLVSLSKWVHWRLRFLLLIDVATCVAIRGPGAASRRSRPRAEALSTGALSGKLPRADTSLDAGRHPAGNPRLAICPKVAVQARDAIRQTARQAGGTGRSKEVYSGAINPLLASCSDALKEAVMPLWTPDPTFYPSPKMAMEAPPEKLAFVAMLTAGNGNHKDALGVVDTDRDSSTYGKIVGKVDMPHGDNELHHFGWNACSSCLCPYAPHPHMERR